MNLRKATNYTVGLDLGTASVGWAVVDENGELYHINGKPSQKGLYINNGRKIIIK